MKLVILSALTLLLATATPAVAQTPGAWVSTAAPAGLSAAGAQWIKVDAPGGRKLLAAVLRPAGDGPFPVVVLLHGAGGLLQGPLGLGEEVARAGFLTVVGCWQLVESPPAAAPNPVCSEAPPQAEWQLDSAKVSGKELIAAAKTLPDARADRVGLLGLSRGGNAALWAASTGSSVQAIVGDAPAHLPLRVTPQPLSTQTVVAGLSAPLLLLHGTSDQTVPVEQTRDYERAARALGKSVSVVYFEGAGHQTTLAPPGEPEALAAARRTPEARRLAIAFLQQHLAAGPAPAQLPRTLPRTGTPAELLCAGLAASFGLVAAGAGLRRPRLVR